MQSPYTQLSDSNKLGDEYLHKEAVFKGESKQSFGLYIGDNILTPIQRLNRALNSQGKNLRMGEKGVNVKFQKQYNKRQLKQIIKIFNIEDNSNQYNQDL